MSPKIKPIRAPQQMPPHIGPIPIAGLFSFAQVASVVHRSESTIARWARMGKVATVELGGRHFVAQEGYDALLAEIGELTPDNIAKFSKRKI